MRGILCLCLLSGIAAIVWDAPTAALAAPRSDVSAAQVRGNVDGAHVTGRNSNDWRRTSHGWERKSNWACRTRISPVAVLPIPHPLVVAALVLLLSLAALVGLSPAPNGDRRRVSIVASRR